jgi:hypothetical protein
MLARFAAENVGVAEKVTVSELKTVAGAGVELHTSATHAARP